MRFTQQHLELLKKGGATTWNTWRQEHPAILPELHGADLSGADLRTYNLSLTILKEANLRGANLSACDLIEADLNAANLANAEATAQSLNITVPIEEARHGRYHRYAL